MDSLNLIKIKEKDKYSIIFKKGYLLKTNNILLIISIILKILIIYVMLKLINNLNKIKNDLFNFFFNHTSKQQNIRIFISKILAKNKDNLIKDINYNIKNQLENKIIINKKVYENKSSIIEEYKKQQNNFCDYSNKYINNKYEELLKLTNFSFKGLSYQLYVYKKYDNFISNYIINKGKYEESPMLNFLKALKYYSKKNNILNNKDIFILDVGGNIGAHTAFLGKFGYSILTFEASPRNNYILNKNYCHINRFSNIIIINKGVSNEEKTCNYYSQMNGIGNGFLLCDENKNVLNISRVYFNKTFEVNLTKLENFIPYLSNKNLALIKLDIEGAEGKAIEGGIELINKIHVPFIFSEFNPTLLKMHGTDPKKYLQLFIDNGYKISRHGFFSNSFISIDKIKGFGNLYFIYNETL